MLETLKEWDKDLFIWLNSLGVETYDSFWVFVTQIESWIPLFVFFFILVFYYYGTKRGLLVAFFVIMTFTITILCTNVVKEFVGRLRPNNVEALSDLIRVLQKPTSYSFFSGHASSSFSITTFIVLALKKHTKWIYMAFLWPLIFVLSRIYVGVHYPSDILFGALVGTVIAFVMYCIFKKIVVRIST